MFLKFLIILIFVTNYSYGQSYYTLYDHNETDLSYYTIAQINDSIWWVGGKNGALSSVSISGKVKSVEIEFNGKDIFQIINDDSFIYIVGEGPQLCIINKENFEYSLFNYDSLFNNGCFYDLIVLPDNKLLVCGGHHGITNAQKKIPRGFIGIIDLNCSENKVSVTHKNLLKFFFAATTQENNIIYASGFNGVFSVIYKSMDYGKNWQRHSRIRGIIHDMLVDNDKRLWYSGTTRIRYFKTGMIGNIYENSKNRKKFMNGCIWSMYKNQDTIYAVNNAGEILKICKNNFEIMVEPTISNNAIYFINQFTNQSMILGGRSKNLIIKTYPNLN